MNSALNPYFDRFVIEFIEDILVCSKNEEEYVEHLETLLILLRENHLYVKLNNYNFFKTQVHYLGDVVSKDGIVVDP